MRTGESAGPERSPASRTAQSLEDLIPIAVVVAAGCESCAEKMVARALGRGSSAAAIERTLRIVAHQRSLDCFLESVGPEVAARMDKPLAAGLNALRRRARAEGCCSGAMAE
jgi:hypothetical protein